VDGTSTVVDCGLPAFVAFPVLTVSPAGSTYSAIAFGDGACTAIDVDGVTVTSSSSWSPSLVVQVTDEPTEPGDEGTLMITVADTVAPSASVPNWQVASPADVVHEPAETTCRTLNPAGAGASSWVFCNAFDAPFVNVVR
jgi:hypothetical protein